MNYTESQLAEYYNWGTKNSNPRINATYNPTGAITKITIHHMAGIMGARQCANMHHNGNASSANYYVGNDGKICQGVPESRRAWTTGSQENDYKAITIEVSNSSGAPDWKVSDKALNATIALCVDICKRNGIKQINYTGDKKGNLTMHCWYQATACPGPYLKGKFAYIANEINKQLSGTPAPTPTPSTNTLYKVQIGAFKVKENAEKQLEKAKKAGFSDAYIVEVKVD